MPAMVRKQVYITETQNSRLRRAAARQRRTEAELVRDALDAHLAGAAPSPSRLADDRLFDIVGLGRSGEGTLSTDVDRLLYAKRRP